MILILLGVFLFFTAFGFFSLYFLVDDVRAIAEVQSKQHPDIASDDVEL